MKRWRLIAGLFAHRQTNKDCTVVKIKHYTATVLYTRLWCVFIMSEIEELQKKYSELENKYRDSIRENGTLTEKIKEQATLMMQLRIDLVAEMKMATTQ